MKKFTIAFFSLNALFANIATAQTCATNIPLSHTEGQYILNDDGTVTDVVNGLMWTACAIGQSYTDGACTGTPQNYSSWQEALVAGNEFGTFAENDDWRLPNIKELADLVERSCVAPAIDLSVFPGTLSAAYWSNTLDYNDINVGGGIDGLLVDFSDGTEFLTDLTSYKLVRMIRVIND